jgi:hypothetical protein
MDELNYYRRHSRVTAPGGKQHLLSGLPADVPALAEVIGGVLVHRDQTCSGDRESPWVRPIPSGSSRHLLPGERAPAVDYCGQLASAAQMMAASMATPKDNQGWK